jgi:hypothetical protein
VDELSSYEPFATAQEFADDMRIGLSANDAFTVEQRLAEASNAVRQECGWQIFPQITDDTFELDGPGGSNLLLPVNYVTAVGGVNELGTDLTDGTDYEWSRHGVIVRGAGRPYLSWTRRPRGITVSGVTHGYVVAPQAIKGLVIGMVGRTFDAPSGRIREQAGLVAVTYAQTSPSVAGQMIITQFEKGLLNGYRAASR